MYLYDSLTTSVLGQLIREKKHRFLGQENHLRFGNIFPLIIKVAVIRKCRFVKMGVPDEALRHLGQHGKSHELWIAIDAMPSHGVCGGDLFLMTDGHEGWSDANRVSYTTRQDEGVPLVCSPYFTMAVYDLDDPITIDYSELDSFVVLVGIQGSAEVVDDSGQHLLLREGETILIPAVTKNIKVEGTIKFLEAYV